jgi:uncharacterized protein YegL
MSIVLDLSKKFELNLQKVGFTEIPRMRTRMACDRSGSMGGLFSMGFVEKVVEMFMGASAKFDDDGDLEYVFFNSSSGDMKTITLDNYKNLSIPSATGGTNYVPALKQLISDIDEDSKAGFFGSIFGSKKTAPSDPIYIGFITDGEPMDLSESTKLLQELESKNVFVQFIVLGSGVNESTMNRLTSYANACYHVVNNPSTLNVDELYQAMANTKLLKWVTSK